MSGTTLVVPAGFTMDISGDRPDLIRVEGVLRPEGSPASPQHLTFTQGGVEVAPGGLFNMYGASLTLRTDSSVIGGELRNVGTLVVGGVNNEHHTFTQTAGMTSVNGIVRIGDGSSTAQGTLNMDGGSLSIGSTMYVGSSGSAFTEGLFRQSAGTTSVGQSIRIANGDNTTGTLELLDGTLTVADSIGVANGSNADGTLVIGGGSLHVTNNVTIGRSDGSSMGQLTQSNGDFLLDAIMVHDGGRYERRSPYSAQHESAPILRYHRLRRSIHHLNRHRHFRLAFRVALSLRDGCRMSGFGQIGEAPLSQEALQRRQPNWRVLERSRPTAGA